MKIFKRRKASEAPIRLVLLAYSSDFSKYNLIKLLAV